MPDKGEDKGMSLWWVLPAYWDEDILYAYTPIW